MFRWFKERKEKKKHEQEIRNQIDDLMVAQLEKAANSSDPDDANTFISNAKELSEIRDKRDALEVEKAKNVISKVSIATTLATTGIGVGAQAFAIKHADSINAAGMIDTTEYGKTMKRNLFSLPLKK